MTCYPPEWGKNPKKISAGPDLPALITKQHHPHSVELPEFANAGNAHIGPQNRAVRCSAYVDWDLTHELQGSVSSQQPYGPNALGKSGGRNPVWEVWPGDRIHRHTRIIRQ